MKEIINAIERNNDGVTKKKNEKNIAAAKAITAKLKPPRGEWVAGFAQIARPATPHSP